MTDDDGLVPDDPTPQTETTRGADPVPDAPPPDDGAEGEAPAGAPINDREE